MFYALNKTSYLIFWKTLEIGKTVTKRLKAKEQKKTCHVNISQKKNWTGYTTVGQSRFQSRESNFRMINGPIHQEDKIILYVFRPNNKDSKYMKQKVIELMGELG